MGRLSSGNLPKLKTNNDALKINAGTNNDENNVKFIEPNLKGDWINLFLLVLLYIMQGIPLGIYGAIPILIQGNKNVTYSDQAILTLADYPFCFKILWAPMVDALYVQKFGRRKSWLVPIQYMIGIVFTYMAWKIDSLLPENGKPNIVMLTCVFFLTEFLVSIQDISVDGWSLTILQKHNVGYASICNLTGQAIGTLLGNMPLVLLTSESFCNNHLRTTPVHGEGGILTLKSMPIYISAITMSIIFGWSMFFIIITTLIAVFKKEKDCTLEENHVKVNVLENYSLLWYVLKIPSIQILAIILVTQKIGSIPATYEIVSLKLIDAGISKDVITITGSLLSVLNILLPMVIGKFISGTKAMNIYLQSSLIRLPMNVAFALLIYYTPSFLSEDNGIVQIPTYYYAILVVTFLIQNVFTYATDVPLVYFFSQISDARFGGTYMTLLNTLTSFGEMWSSTFAFSLLDKLTITDCSTNNCYLTDQLKTCDGSQCESRRILVDGYHVEILLCTIVGIVWYFMFRNEIKRLRSKSNSDWIVDVKKLSTGNVNKAYSTDESPL